MQDVEPSQTPKQPSVGFAFNALPTGNKQAEAANRLLADLFVTLIAIHSIMI